MLKLGGLFKVAKRSKRIQSIKEKLEPNKTYAAEEAFKLLQSLPRAKFVESIDASVNLGVDPRKSDQIVRGSTLLPHGTGKQVRVAAFVQSTQLDTAYAAGADIAGLEDLAEQIKQGQMNFDVVVATPDTMRIVGTLGKILGPRGLMPNPKVGTVTPDIAGAIKNVKGGQIRYRTDKSGIIHCTIGKISFKPEALGENLKTLIADLNKIKPSTSKGVYIRKVTVSSTMGAGLTIDQVTL